MANERIISLRHTLITIQMSATGSKGDIDNNWTPYSVFEYHTTLLTYRVYFVTEFMKIVTFRNGILNGEHCGFSSFSPTILKGSAGVAGEIKREASSNTDRIPPGIVRVLCGGNFRPQCVRKSLEMRSAARRIHRVFWPDKVVLHAVPRGCNRVGHNGCVHAGRRRCRRRTCVLGDTKRGSRKIKQKKPRGGNNKKT